MSISDELTADLEWLRELNRKSWKVHPPQYSGGRKNHGWSEDLPISEEDGKRALELFKKHREKMVFEPGSGVFGFGVSITAYYLEWGTYPGVPNEPIPIITLTSKQLFRNGRKQEQTDAYKEFESFTHTEENKKRREAAGFKDKLHDYSYYDY